MKRAVLVLLTLFLAVSVSHAQTNWTGDGGRGKSIAIVAPQATGLPDSLNYLPVLVQGELVSNFTMFSAISVLDRQNYETQLLELMEEIYSDRARESLNLGNLPHTDYLMDGTITRTRTGYNLQVRVLRTSDHTTVATHSATTTFDELDNLTGVRRASLELLQRMGVTLTAQAQTALGGAATSSHVSAQTALAQGIMAQRQGTEVAALSYFYQAASFDPSLAEAVGRSQIMSANISSANIGENIRNDIVWRRDWVNRLRETEVVFYNMLRSADPPYRWFYSTNIQQGNINYQQETADLSITIDLIVNNGWFTAMNQALQAAKRIMDGLNETGRKNDWQLENWPWWQGVSSTNPFSTTWRHEMTVEFELVNERGRVIGRQTIRLNPAFQINRDFVIGIPQNTENSLTFRGVSANDISDNLTIRVASVNGNSPQTARFPIRALSDEERQLNNLLLVENGVLMGIREPQQRRGQQSEVVIPSNFVIPKEVWGEQITAIGERAFENRGLRRVTIPDGLITIENNAFRGNDITRIIIGTNISANVLNAFPGLSEAYEANEHRAGTYTYAGQSWGLAGTESERERQREIELSERERQRVEDRQTRLASISGQMTDPRDGQVYRTARMPDGKTWMAENLNYRNPRWRRNDFAGRGRIRVKDKGSWCYGNDANNCNIYGRLYTWSAAMKACPAGWRLPTDRDWDALMRAVGGANTAGTKLKSSTGWEPHSGTPVVTDDFGFSALLGGNRNWHLNRFRCLGGCGEWWSATRGTVDSAPYRNMKYDDEGVGSYYDIKGAGFSVRCVRDD